MDAVIFGVTSNDGNLDGVNLPVLDSPLPSFVVPAMPNDDDDPTVFEDNAPSDPLRATIERIVSEFPFSVMFSNGLVFGNGSRDGNVRLSNCKYRRL